MSQIAQTNKPKNTEDCLGGWCRLHSRVYTDFYNSEADRPREVERIILWPDGSASVDLKAEEGLKTVPRVDFVIWIKQSPPTSPK